MSVPEPAELALAYLDSDTERRQFTTTAWEAHQTKLLDTFGQFVSSRDVFGADERRKRDETACEVSLVEKPQRPNRQNNPF